MLGDSFSLNVQLKIFVNPTLTCLVKSILTHIVAHTSPGNTVRSSHVALWCTRFPVHYLLRYPEVLWTELHIIKDFQAEARRSPSWDNTEEIQA